MGQFRDKEEESSRVEHLAQQAEDLPLVDQLRLLQRLAHCVEQKIDPALPALDHAPPVAAHEMVAPSSTVAPAHASDVLDAITYRIIGCAQAVHRRLGKGLREEEYQRALATQFVGAGLACRPQQKFSIFDRPLEDGDPGRLLGYYIPDFVVEDQVIVEIKALAVTDDSHVAQVIGYMTVSDCRVGLLINFGERSLHPRRILPPADMRNHVVNAQWLWNPFRTP